MTKPFYSDVRRAIQKALFDRRPSRSRPSESGEILQEICKSTLALLALSAPFRICKLQILLAARVTDPVSGHHFQSLANPSVRVFISNSFQLVA